MLGKTNSSVGGKASGTASYIFENSTKAKSYPVDEMTEAGWKTFPFNFGKRPRLLLIRCSISR